MATRTEVLVAYDLAENKARTKLFEALKDHGLQPIQKSVMWGFLSQAEQKAVKRLFDDMLAENDRAFLIRANVLEQASGFAGSYPPGLKKEESYDIF